MKIILNSCEAIQFHSLEYFSSKKKKKKNLLKKKKFLTSKLIEATHIELRRANEFLIKRLRYYFVLLLNLV